MMRSLVISTLVVAWLCAGATEPVFALEESSRGPGEGVPAEEVPDSGGEPVEEGTSQPGEEKEPEDEEKPPEVIYLPPPIRDLKKSDEKSLLVLEPRAISYKFIFERIHIGSGADEGSKIKPERHLGLDDVLFLSPEINTQLNFKIFGFLARLHFSYTDTTLHGLARLPKEIGFNGTIFPAGLVVGTQFTHRRASVRYFQEVFQSDLFTVDVNVGGDYLYFRNVLDSPGFAREKDVTENAMPILGTRVFIAPFDWGRFFVRLSGFYWNLGRDMGATGVFELSAGVSVYFTKTWGFFLDFSFQRISVREERLSRAQIDYWEFGPGIAIYASI